MLRSPAAGSRVCLFNELTVMRETANSDTKNTRTSLIFYSLGIALLASLSTGLYWNGENGAKISTSEAKEFSCKGRLPALSENSYQGEIQE